MQMILAIAAGGALGALLRHGVNQASMHILGPAFPWGTVMVNILGSFAMGLLIALFAHLGNPSQELRGFLTVGFLGAFTTFSAFSLDVANLWERGDFLMTGGYITASVMLSVAALFSGLWIVRSAWS